MKDITFKVLKVYYSHGEQHSFDVYREGFGIERVYIHNCAELFKRCKCENAVIVKGKYIRGKHGALEKAELSFPDEYDKAENQRSHWEGVYSNVPIEGIAFEKTKTVSVKTKRYIYSIAESRIKDWNSGETEKWQHAVMISGPKQIGKTTLLYQLYNNYESSIFVDGESFRGSFKALLETAKKSGIKHIFVDEADKIYDDESDNMIDAINKDHDIFIIAASSVYFIFYCMSEMTNIDDGATCELIELPPILYTERLAWGNNISSDEIQQAVRFTSNDRYIKWLTRDNLFQGSIGGYIKAALRDVLDSKATYYRERQFVEGFKYLCMFSLSLIDEELEEIIDYIACCQLLYFADTEKKYSDSPVLADKLRAKLDEMQSRLRPEAIESVRQLLTYTDISVETSYFNTLYGESEAFSADTDKYKALSCLLQFPQLFKNNLIADLESLLTEFLVEYNIFMKAYYYWCGVKKKHIDATLCTNAIFYFTYCDYESKLGKNAVLSVQNRPSNIFDEDIEKYINAVCNDADELIFSCNDKEFESIDISQMKESTLGFAGIMRNDVIVTLLELGLIKVQRSGAIGVEETFTLKELYDEFYLS